MANITLEIETKKIEEVNIPVPSYFRNFGETEFIGLIDDKTVISVCIINDFVNIIKRDYKNNTFAKNDIITAYNTFISCRDFEFIQAYDRAIEMISSHPMLAI